ncbi:MAG: signal peptide peptidase SppA [Treponema sp.]|jgi:protease-4|nr:signal peptide peptidase SppA [Treponema sp.]
MTMKYSGARPLAIGVLGLCLISAPVFSNARYLELNLNNSGLQNSLNPHKGYPLLETLRVIERAGKDKNIGGMVLNISGFSADRELVWELRAALENFKASGKKICAFISSADLDLYFLASAADTIVMDEQGTLALLGYAWGRGYARNALEKLGVGARELRYLEFKSAAETYTRNSISGADKIQYGAYLDDIFTVTRNTLMKARSWTEEEFNTIINNEYIYSPKAALERGLVDRTGRAGAVEEAVNALAGTGVTSFVLYGEASTALMGYKNRAYNSTRASVFAPRIAVITASGQTDLQRGMAARSLSRTIREVSERHSIKAIVIRINSPGGAADAADYIAEAIQYAKQRIPVVVSMGPVAASGGYWASMYASHITASPFTLTGSIGVIGNWFYDDGLNKKLGLTVDALKKGDHSDLSVGIIFPRRDLSAEEEARYRTFILDLYGDFTKKVAAGRNMDIETVEAAAQGRVYSGLGALDVGLIDSIGGLDDALRIARNLAEIPEKQKVRYEEYPKPRFIDRFMERFTAPFLTRENSAASSMVTGLLISEPLLEDLLYRISHNGQVMPILPLELTGE